MRWHYKYVKAFTLGLQNSMEYRSDFFISMISALFPIFIQLFMWTSIYGNSGRTVMFGYSFAQMVTYTVIASIVSRLIRTGFEYEINDEIKNGGFNKFIVRPIGYFSYKLSCFLGQKLFQLGLTSILLCGVIIMLSLKFGHSFGASALLGFTASLLLAFVLNFIIFFCISMVAFWLSEIGFFFEAVRIVIIAFSGGIFPLDVFSSGFLSVLNYLPFKYTVNFPVDVLNGRLAGTDILKGLLVQLMWILLLSGVSRLLWRSGTKKYIAVGG